ncbi:hypothetical protein BASA81_003609 [Batrachochytrium salamandrivorans]|nr:hypothetical protein BASA81_003609 [Batrachochytrium salamandrivorans]
MKTYLRYEPQMTTGTIASSKSNSLLIQRNKSLLALTPAFDSVLVWDVMRTVQLFRFEQNKDTDGEVSCLAVDSESPLVLAVGRTKGKVDLYDLGQMNSKEKQAASPRVSLSGHRSQVTCACFSKDASKLATGSRDTFVILWDVIGEVGLFRLNGHRDEVTCLRFSANTMLVSSSKDTTIKLWDLESQHCEKTIADHSQSVWGFDIHSQSLYSGSSDGLVRSFARDTGLVLGGSVNRQASSERCESVLVCNSVLALQSSTRVEFYRIRSETEAGKKQKRRVRRMREKKEVDDDSMWTSDCLELACVLRSPHRIRSVSMLDDRVLVAYTNNLVEVYVITTVSQEDGEAEETTKKAKLVSHLEIVTRFELQGHRTDIRALALGDSDELVMSAADGAAKVWSVESGACLRTIKTGFALCLAFVPNTTLAVVGTREGTLQVCNYQTGQTVRDFPNAHGEGNAVYSLDIRPDGKGMVTCGGDKTCKFWDFKFSPAFAIAHTRTLRFENSDFQCVRYSKGKEIKVCVAMLDNTVKVFHEDSLAFALSLYGHKLPVLAMDCSDDGTLLATASADKTIKVWGMDFGDCHSSTFAHEGSVTSVKFVAKTHYLVSCGRDGRVRYWDSDANMQRILSFDSFGDLYGLCMSKNGSFFFSAGKDKQLKKYVRTKDIVFVDEEQEKEMAKQMDLEDDAFDVSMNNPTVTGNGVPESTLQVNTKKTNEAVEAGDALIELLSGVQPDSELEELGRQVAKFARSIKANDLHDAMVFLPYIHVKPLVIAFAFALQERAEVELMAKSALVLLQIHGTRMGPDCREALEMLQQQMRDALWETRDVFGVNFAGLRDLDRKAKEHHQVS